jgi:tetratricopeptide (TPR) repeat protein
VTTLEQLAKEALLILQLCAVGAALLLLVILLGATARTIAKALFGHATYVIPFTGCELAPAVSTILTQQLGEVEREWTRLSRAIIHEVDAFLMGEAIRTTVGHVQADLYLDSEAGEWVEAQPIDGHLVKSITAFGVTVSPETVFSLLYRLRDIVAPRVIHGTVHRLGTTIRLSIHMSERRGRGRRHRHYPRLRPVDATDELLQLIDDAAFGIVRRRVALWYRRPDLEADPEADTWAGYRSFQEGYVHHLRFLRTGNPDEREAAAALYETAIQAEGDHHLAHYNLGILMYARYTAVGNEGAIQHFESAMKCSSDKIRMLALAGLSMANGQQVHRYGFAGEPQLWINRADEASRHALRICAALGRPTEEVYFARGWSHQVRGGHVKAIEWYSKAIDIPLCGDAVRLAEQRRMKSFAETNAGYLAMTELGDLEKAEALFESALLNNPFNQMSHANLAEVFRRRGEFDRAIQEYGAALDLESNYFNAMNEMALLYIEMALRLDVGDPDRTTRLDRARRLHEQAVAMVSDDNERDRERLRVTFAQAIKSAESGRAWLNRSLAFMWPHHLARR